MAYVGVVPWHGLGVKVSNELTPQQMMKAAGLDWSVEKQDVFLANGQKLGNTQALVRTSDNKVLDTVGKDWNPVQNAEAFEFFAEYVLAGDMEMNTAGSLFDGKRVWALAKVKESFDILGGDQVDSYLLFSNPHKYGHAIDVRFTPIRVVCNNTLSLSLGKNATNGVKLNHRAEFNPEMVKEQLGIANEKFGQYKEIAQFLASKRFSVDSMIEFYSSVFPHASNKAPKNVEEMSRPAKQCYEVLETQPGAQYGEGSFWQLVNSLTFYVDHQAGRNTNTRLNSAWFGSNAKRKNEGMNKALELANAA
jgi:phage/plasmid-like protein (TIGR03299 family)